MTTRTWHLICFLSVIYFGAAASSPIRERSSVSRKGRPDDPFSIADALIKHERLPSLTRAVFKRAIPVERPIQPSFADRSEKSGISSRSRFKYGAPMIADVDGDGWDDFALGEHENGNARVYLRSSPKSFTLAYDHSEKIDYHGMAAYNFDGNGSTLDLIMNRGGLNGARPSVPDIFKWLPASKAFLKYPGSELGLAKFQTRGRAVLLLDVDLDGDEDVILTGRTVGMPDQLSEMILLRNDGSGGWTPYDNLQVKHAFCYTAILTIDLDNDSIMDLVCTERGRISVLRGTGSFPEPFEDVSEKWLDSIPGPWWGYYDYMADLDYDNDGNMDVYVTCGLNYTFDSCDDLLLRNDGAKFVDVSAAARIPTGGVHQEPAAGDFNLDGHIDLLLPSYGTKLATTRNILLINRGDGTFETTTSHGINIDQPTSFRGAGASTILTDRRGHLNIIMGYEGDGSAGGGPCKFYKNTTPQGSMNFLAFKVNDIPSSNLLARGAKVTVEIGGKRMIRRVGSVGGQSQSFQRRVHFGLGNASMVDSVVIEYLGGGTRSRLKVQGGFREGDQT